MITISELQKNCSKTFYKFHLTLTLTDLSMNAVSLQVVNIHNSPQLPLLAITMGRLMAVFLCPSCLQDVLLNFRSPLYSLCALVISLIHFLIVLLGTFCSPFAYNHFLTHMLSPWYSQYPSTERYLYWLTSLHLCGDYPAATAGPFYHSSKYLTTIILYLLKR